MDRNPHIAKMRSELATRTFDQGMHWRILLVGRSVNGSTDIVSCLSRSLRNLGHHVLDLDLKRHRVIAENPGNAKGGNGPIFVRSGPLEAVLQRFRPQMIVCCAGGLTFREDEAEALKRRGIVLVGITLSDPDVFPTVHGFAHVFDFHTTNARVAMNMYSSAGIHNTLYFPFGIDRGFVTQSVPAAPELSADVICIGHATARPERNGVMSHLAQQLDVRTYGRGWDLPGSVVVEGRRMVQASREGRVHVNFPLTRAGYINIKCGVFESVGSGALVATGRFDEMEDFFAYDEEITGYRDEQDLLVQLGEVLADPDRYRRMTERAFERLVNAHLYEHRWMDLFREILEKAGPDAGWLGEARAAQVRAILSDSLPRSKQILLSGFYGASNVGDELILRSISSRIEAADPAAQVWVAAENPEQVERNHGLQAISRKALPQALHAARTASAVVLGGGGLWHDYTFERSGGLLGLFNSPQISIAGFGALPLMGRMFDAPFHVVGLGIGPLSDPDAKRMARFIAGHAESIMVRDAESAAFAAEICPFPERVRQAPDVVYALPLDAGARGHDDIEAFRTRGYRVVGLNLRPWAHTDEEALVQTVAAALQRAAAGQPLALIGIPMQAGDRVDPLMLARVAARLGDSLPALVLKAPLTTEELIRALGSIDALISMRLHACLLAHRLGTPVVGIAYDPKVANHFAEIGRSHVCLSLPLEPEALDRAIDVVLAENELPADTDGTLRRLEIEALTALDDVCRKIAAAPSRQVVHEVPRTDAPVTVAAVAPAMGRPARQPLPPFTSRFCDTIYTAAGAVTVPALLPARTDRTLSVWLPVHAPVAGDAMQVASHIDVQGEGEVELSLALHSAYENPRAAGRMSIFLEIDDRWHLVQDLASSADPIQLRLFCPAPRRISIRLGLHVLRNAFASQAWPRLSRVELRLGDTAASAHGCDMRVVATGGQLRRRPSGLPDPGLGGTVGS